MTSEFVRHEFEWLAQVASDASLTATSVRLAIVMLSYFNRETREARPAVATLAVNLQVSERSVQRAIAELEQRHLQVTSGGGRRRANRYRWKIEALDSAWKPRQTCQGLADETPSGTSPFEDERVTALTVKGDNLDAKTLTRLSPEPIEENLLKEPLSLSPVTAPAKKEGGEELMVWIEKVLAAYPQSKNHSPKKVIDALQATPRAAWPAVVAGCVGYAAEYKLKPTTHPKALDGFISERVFENYDGKPSPAVTFVKQDTPEWRARVAAGHKPGLNYAKPPEGVTSPGWYFPASHTPVQNGFTQ